MDSLKSDNGWSATFTVWPGKIYNLLKEKPKGLLVGKNLCDLSDSGFHRDRHGCGLIGNLMTR